MKPKSRKLATKDRRQHETHYLNGLSIFQQQRETGNDLWGWGDYEIKSQVAAGVIWTKDLKGVSHNYLGSGASMRTDSDNKWSLHPLQNDLSLSSHYLGLYPLLSERDAKDRAGSIRRVINGEREGME